jgi:hypothetical protein
VVGELCEACDADNNEIRKGTVSAIAVGGSGIVDGYRTKQRYSYSTGKPHNSSTGKVAAENGPKTP